MTEVTTKLPPSQIGNEAVPVEWRETPMTALDRCDRCGAQAYVRTFHDIGNGMTGDLIWCGHHYARNEQALEAVTRHVQDERHVLTPPLPKD